MQSRSARDDEPTSRADLHCHSTASQVSKLGVQRALGLPECATPPEEVYALAKRRGMDFVTITDHDTIDGRRWSSPTAPDVFVSEELTAWFRGEPQAVHVLCYGHHAGRPRVAAGARRRRRGRRRRTCTSTRSPARWRTRSTPSRRRCCRATAAASRSSSRSGRRATARARRELNAPAAIYIETHGGTGVGGSDDHAGVDIGRTFTETPPARDAGASSSTTSRRARQRRAASRAAPRSGRTRAMALATRALGRGDGDGAAPDPAASCAMVAARHARGRRPHRRDRRGPRARRRPRAAARLAATPSTSTSSERELLALLQAEDFSHADLFRRARRATSASSRARSSTIATARPAGARPRGGRGGAFDACIAAIPYAPAAAFLGREKAQARAPRRRAAARRARRRRASAGCTASRTRSTRSASAACPASRSRSSAPTRTSTAA